MATEKRLIDANALKDRFKLRLDWLEKDVHDEYTTGLHHGCDYDITLIDEQPTVDAVEVVRCKDCKHYLYDAFDGCYVCMQLNKYVKTDFWCSYGERKDNGL